MNNPNSTEKIIEAKVVEIVTKNCLLGKDKKKYAICDFFGNFELEEKIREALSEVAESAIKETIKSFQKNVDVFQYDYDKGASEIETIKSEVLKSKPEGGRENE